MGHPYVAARGLSGPSPFWNLATASRSSLLVSKHRNSDVGDGRVGGEGVVGTDGTTGGMVGSAAGLTTGGMVGSAAGLIVGI